MPSLKIAIGYTANGSAAKPFPIYVGHSGAEMDAALKASAAARFEIFPSAYGLRKNNPRAAANAARLAAEAQAQGAAIDAAAAERATLVGENAELRELLRLAEGAYTVANCQIADLRTQLGAVPAPTEILPAPVVNAAEPDAPAAAPVPSGAAASKAARRKPGPGA
jgi:hypothetical protein